MKAAQTHLPPRRCRYQEKDCLLHQETALNIIFRGAREEKAYQKKTKSGLALLKTQEKPAILQRQIAKDLNNLKLRNVKIYGLFEQKHLEDKEVLRPEDLNFCIS